jgi:hypothetical protein
MLMPIRSEYLVPRGLNTVKGSKMRSETRIETCPDLTRMLKIANFAIKEIIRSRASKQNIPVVIRYLIRLGWNPKKKRIVVGFIGKEYEQETFDRY